MTLLLLARRGEQRQARIMDAGQVTVSGPSGHAVSQWRLPLRRLRTGDTMRTLANGLVAQPPVDPLGLGVGVPRLLVGRATGNHQAARASGVTGTAQRAWSMTCLTGRFHSQIDSTFVARAWPGGCGGPSPANA